MTAFTVYLLQAHLLLAASYLLFALGVQAISLLQREISANFKALFLRALFLLALLAPLLAPPLHFLSIKPTAEIWSAPTFRGRSLAPSKGLTVSLGNSKTTHTLPIDPLPWATLLLSSFGTLATALRMLRDRRRIRSLALSAIPMKRVGGVAVLASSEIGVPFSFGKGRRATVFIPTSALDQPHQLKLILQHEFTHLRRRDTALVYADTLIRSFFWMNPFIHLIFRQLNELTELACDEAMVDQKKVSPQAYGRCLWEVAHNHLAFRAIPVGTTGLARSGKFLKWRIKTMLKRKEQIKTPYACLWAGVLLVSFSLFAANSRAWVQDRRVTMEEAQRMLQKSQENSTFPVVLNEEVLRELNRYLGTPDGREFIARSLDNMRAIQPMLEKTINEYHLPLSLLAVPITESGYENLPPGKFGNLGAGIWQFIPQTARRYGLLVDEKSDERRDATLATDAACRYLGSLYMQFRDWQLATMAYNAGENKVQRGIEKTKSRDAWTLIRAGFGGDAGYLAKLNAAVLILNNSVKFE